MENFHKKLDKNALAISKQYSGKIAITTIILALLVVLIYPTVLFLFANKFLPPLMTIFFLMGLTFASYIPMHEAVHGNIGGNNSKLKWLDKLIGYMMAPIIAIPFTSHQKEHFTHHKNTNKDDILMFILKIFLGLLKIFINQQFKLSKHKIHL